MKKYRIYEGLWASFYSPEFYRSVVYRWQGAGMLYLALVVVVSSLITSGVVGTQIWEARQQIPALAEQLPTLIFTKEGLQTEPEGLHEILDPQTGELVGIIDTSQDRPPATRAERRNVPVYVSRKQMLVTNVQGQEQLMSLTPWSDHRLEPEDFRRAAELVLVLAILALPIVLTFFFFFLRTLQTFALALVTWIFSGIMGRKLDYFDRIRLSAAALTPAMLVEAVAGSFIADNDIVFFALAILYAAYAVYVVRPPQPPPIPEDATSDTL